MCIIDWPTRIVPDPIEISLEKLFLQFRDILRVKYATTSRNDKSKIDPKNPNSSAKTANIKSVLLYGRYCNFCIDRPYPSPNNPPEPIA